MTAYDELVISSGASVDRITSSVMSLVKANYGLPVCLACWGVCVNCCLYFDVCTRDGVAQLTGMNRAQRVSLVCAVLSFLWSRLQVDVRECERNAFSCMFAMPNWIYDVCKTLCVTP